MNREERCRYFVEEIWGWYIRHKRRLPWRDLAMEDETERVYQILVSEIMLQQTQVSRVIVIYKRFLRQFPTLAALANASNREVITAWRGMGYNSRALRLRDAARAILAPNPLFPRTIADLTSIPGIGPYTAAAIRNFAFNIPTPCLDTNIRRILHRTFVGPENPDGTWAKGDKYLLKLAERVLIVALSLRPAPAEWHAALMDFGSMIQTKNNPKWHLCPLTAAGIMKTTPKNFPLSSVRSPTSEVLREPGRMVGATFIPNRIFRGKIIEALRDAKRGLPLKKIGSAVCIDWGKEHLPWLQHLITKLIQEGFVSQRRQIYQLRE